MYLYCASTARVDAVIQHTSNLRFVIERGRIIILL